MKQSDWLTKPTMRWIGLSSPNFNWTAETRVMLQLQPVGYYPMRTSRRLPCYFLQRGFALKTRRSPNKSLPEPERVGLNRARLLHSR